MKHIAFFLTLLVSFYTSGADNIFRDEEAKLSFRYPANWSERKPQLHTTLVLLFADDGSDATCNITTKKIKKLEGLSEAQLEKLRELNHKREDFEKILKGLFINLSIKNYKRGTLGQKRAGIVEIEYDLFVNDNKMHFTQYMATTFANSRRITLTCNAPSHGISSALEAFGYIRNTIIYSY